MDYLCQSDPTGKYNWLRDENQRYLYAYLLGTEYPDYSWSQADKRAKPFWLDNNQYQVGISPKFGDFHTQDLYAPLAVSRGNKAIKALNGEINGFKLRETAAFYLGVMTHYIVDASCPAHFLDNIALHNWLEDNVGYYSTIQDYSLNLFFEIDLESKLGYTSDRLILEDWLNLIFGGFTPGRHRTMVAAIIYACVDIMLLTVKDNRETNFLLQQQDGRFPVWNFSRFYTDYGQYTFQQLDRHNSAAAKYFDRLEILLNWATYYTACALKVCLDEEKDVDENDDKTPQLPDNSNDRYFLPPEAYEYLARYGFMIAALVAAGIIAKKVFTAKFR